MKIVIVPLILRVLCLVAIAKVASGRRGTVILDQIFKADMAFTETSTTASQTTSTVASTTVECSTIAVDGDTMEEDLSPNVADGPINVQIFYPVQYPLTTTRISKKSPPSRYPIIQIFNYQPTTETTTASTTITTESVQFRLIPLIAHPTELSKPTVKVENDFRNSAYDSLIRSILLLLPASTTSTPTISTKPTTVDRSTQPNCRDAKASRLNDNCNKDDNDDEDDENENDDYSESNTVIFRPPPQRQVHSHVGQNSNSYGQYRQPIANNPFHYGGSPYYGNLPFSGVAPYSYYSNPNCLPTYTMSYWDCIRGRPGVVRQPQKYKLKSTVTTTTTIETTQTTVELQNRHSYFQLIPLLLAQQQQQETTTPALTTKSPTFQLPYIHIIQLPNPYSNGDTTTTAPTTTVFTTTVSTATVVSVPMSTAAANATSSIASTSDEKSLNITILPSNMQCFAVNPECRSIMRMWTRMIPYSSVTRWTKRHWEVTTVTSPTGSSKGVSRTTPKRRQTTEFYYDYSEIDNPIISFGRCNVTVLSAGEAQLANILFYVSTGWIVFWALMLLIVNSIYREFGAHRWLDTYQEFNFVIIYVFMGIFVLKPANNALCTTTTMILLFFLVLNLSIAFMQTFWLSSLIKGSSERNGRLPIFVNYIWPLIVATAVMLTSYFTQRADYASTRVHCFCELFSSLYWTFTLTAWILWFMVLIRNQVAVTACRQSRPAVNAAQIYWAKKSCKATPILVSWFLMSFFALMFAVDLQLLWLCVTYSVLAVIFGPLLFYFHTQNHIRSNNGLAARTYLGLYRVCPLKRQKLLAAAPGDNGATRASGGVEPSGVGHLHRSHSIENPNPALHRHLPTKPPLSIVGHRRQSAPGSISGEPSPAPTINAPPVTFVLPPPAATLSTAGARQAPSTSGNMLSRPSNNIATAPTSAQVFYDWLMDHNEGNIHESENVLFQPLRPV